MIWLAILVGQLLLVFAATRLALCAVDAYQRGDRDIAFDAAGASATCILALILVSVLT